jgi:hypothetical protein
VRVKGVSAIRGITTPAEEQRLGGRSGEGAMTFARGSGYLPSLPPSGRATIFPQALGVSSFRP